MRTLILGYPGCIGFEVMLAAELVHPRFPVTMATPDGARLINTNGLRIEADLPYVDVDPRDYACVLVPGGDPGAILDDDNVDRILAGDAVTGGICAGALVLAKAGVLKGRRATHNYTPERAPPEAVALTAHYWEGLEYVDAPVVVDGKIVTAHPQAFVEFAITIARLLDVVDDSHAAELRRYYSGC